jgi:hypothetical protein
VKVFIGGAAVTFEEIEAKQNFQNKLTNYLMSQVRAEAIDVSANRLVRMAARMQMAATDQAMMIPATIADIVKTNAGKDTAVIKGWQLLRGSNTATLYGSLGSKASGSVTWAPLDYRYTLYKQFRRASLAKNRTRRTMMISSRTAQSYDFFRYSGRLASYFNLYGRSIINKFGGVQVTLTKGDGIAKRSLTTAWRDSKDSNQLSVKTALGRIHIAIFPEIAPMMMAMLSGRNWSDVGLEGRTFDKAMFPEGVASKLTNPKGPYRPLVLPIVQFYTAVRIPGAILKSLGQEINAIKVSA